MAKYRRASEKTIARGKGISTDKLSLKDAKDYFNERAKETGAKRFRHNGQVYDLAGNKITESAPARSSGGGSSAAPGSSRPRANPNRSSTPAKNVGGAKAEQRRLGAPPESGNKAVVPAAVGAMAAGATAAGVIAGRSGRGPAPTGARGENSAKAQRALPKPPARLALPAPNKGGTIIPENKKPKDAPKPTGARGENKSNVQKAIAESRAKPKVKPAKPKKGPGGSRSGVRGGIGIDITTNPLEQIKDPLQLMNKGGMVKKKK